MRSLPAVFVFGAAGAGYLYNNTELLSSLSPASWIVETGAKSHGDGSPADGSAATPLRDAEIVRIAEAPTEELVAVAGPEELALDEIFRFDLTPRAITDRWNRVSTGLGDVRYQGYRVPVVTGPTASDLAGSLTYYFDAQPRLRRITFLGTTGDPARVVEFLSQRFRFHREKTGNARVISYKAGFMHSGRLEVTPADLLDRHQAETNYRIDLSLEQ